MHRHHHFGRGAESTPGCCGHEYRNAPRGHRGHPGHPHMPRGPGSKHECCAPPWAIGAMSTGRHRADRGEVRYLILDALAEQPRHGYDAIQAIKQKSGGGYSPSPGTIYPTLQMLEEIGHVSLQETDEGKKTYTLTAEGRAELDARQDDVDDFYDRVSDEFGWAHAEEFRALFDRIPRVLRAVGRAYRRGRIDADGIAQISAVLDEAVDRIEAIAKGEAKPA